MKRTLAALPLLALALLLGGCAAVRQPEQTPAPAQETMVEELTLDNEPAALYGGVETDRRVVSLIFEGFSDEESMAQIISLMSSRRVDCVFFVSGVTASEQPELVRAISGAGLTVGSYGMTGQKGMEDNSQENNLRQFTRAQQVIGEVCGQTPSLFRCNGTAYTREVLQAAAAAGLQAGVQPTAYINHRSFSGEESAVSFVKRLVRGSVISVKLGQELDADEYGYVVSINEMRPMNDPEPSIARAQDDIPRSIYADLCESLAWLLDALAQEGYQIVSPERLQGEAVTLLGTPRALEPETEALLDASSYLFPVTKEALASAATHAGTLDDLDGAVLVGDSIAEGLGGFMQWQLAARQEDGGAKAAKEGVGLRFLTSSNLSVEDALARVSKQSAHPVYNGEKMSVESALREMGAKRIYLMLMCSDARAYEGSGELTNVKLLLHLIRKSCPDATVCVVSYPPNRSSLTRGASNKSIFRYNLKLCRLCQQYGIPFIDAASALRDEQGRLEQAYCLDAQTYGTHLSRAGCEALLQYLAAHIPN